MSAVTIERRILRFVGTFSPWLNHMLYRPYKGAHRGYWYRLPWNTVPKDEYVSL